jgi:flagellum-specific peptidoglycan hydrolase FlgJ/LysM repeat protein
MKQYQNKITMKRLVVFTPILWMTMQVFAQQPVTPVTHNVDQNSTVKSASNVKEEAAAPAAPTKNEYAEKYKGIAIAEMQRVGIPASIKLAQGILESASGGSELASTANNHFGIKCGSNWDGKTYKKKDDDYNDKGEKIESCFRKYSKPEESFYDHSEFLRDPRKYYRYGFLFGLDRRDYRGWARGLESAGYATEKGYGDKLIDIIEKNKLYQYDDPEIQVMNSGSMDDSKIKDKDKDKNKNNTAGTNGNEPDPIPSRVGRINDVKVVLAQGGETVDDIARTYRISPQKVADFNERKYTPGKPLELNTRVFIQEKKSKWRGRAKHHFVRDNQTMFDISQQYGVKLRELLKRNGMVPGQEPESGEKIRVRGRRKSDEIVRLRETTAPSGKPANTKPNQPATVGEELFDLDGDGASKPSTGGTKPSTSPSTGNPSPVTPPSTKPSTTPTKPSTTPGSGTYPSDPTPSATPQTIPVVTPPPVPVVTPAGYHTVAKGDTLFNLSRKYNIPVARLKALNGLTTDDIKIGQQLRIQ